MARYDDDVDRVFCVTARMSCLIPLMTDDHMCGGSFQDLDPDCIITDAVSKATAICPLHESQKHFWFETNEFFRILLEQTDVEERT